MNPDVLASMICCKCTCVLGWYQLSKFTQKYLRNIMCINMYQEKLSITSIILLVAIHWYCLDLYSQLTMQNAFIPMHVVQQAFYLMCFCNCKPHRTSWNGFMIAHHRLSWGDSPCLLQNLGFNALTIHKKAHFSSFLRDPLVVHIFSGSMLKPCGGVPWGSVYARESARAGLLDTLARLESGRWQNAPLVAHSVCPFRAFSQ